MLFSYVFFFLWCNPMILSRIRSNDPIRWSDPIIRSWFCQRRDFFLERRWTGSSSSLCACVQVQMWIWGSPLGRSKGKVRQDKRTCCTKISKQAKWHPQPKNFPVLVKSSLSLKKEYRLSQRIWGKTTKIVWTVEEKVEEGELSLPFMISASLSTGGGGRGFSSSRECSYRHQF